MTQNFYSRTLLVSICGHDNRLQAGKVSHSRKCQKNIWNMRQKLGETKQRYHLIKANLQRHWMRGSNLSGDNYIYYIYIWWSNSAFEGNKNKGSRDLP